MKRSIFLIISLVLIIVAPIHSQQPQWETLPDMPQERFGHCSVVYKDKVWIIGGKNQFGISISTVDCYDLKQGKWQPAESELLHARYNAAAVVYDDKIYVIGGYDNRQILNLVEYYDPNDKQWKEFFPLLHPREGASAVVFNNKLCVIGGRSNKGILPKILDNVECWDETAQGWQESTLWHLHHARTLMQSVVVDSFIYIIGGRFIDGQLGIVERFGQDGETDSLSSLKVARYYFSAVTINQLIYVLGGVRFGEFDTLANTIEYYATQSDSWYILNVPMLTPRAGLSAVSYEHNIYVFGGMDANLKVSSHAEILIGVPTDIGTAVSNGNEQKAITHPNQHRLLANYPNPFNAATTINLELAKNESQIQLIIFNLMGESIRTFQLNSLSPGFHQIQWDGRDDRGRMVPSGIYLAQLRSDRSCGEVLKLSFIK